MESRAACANAVPLVAQMIPAASEEIRILRVTVIASGCDGRQFMTARLHKYYGPDTSRRFGKRRLRRRPRNEINSCRAQKQLTCHHAVIKLLAASGAVPYNALRCQLPSISRS